VRRTVRWSMLVLVLLGPRAFAAEAEILLVASSAATAEEAARSLLGQGSPHRTVAMPANRILSDAWVLGAALLDACPVASVTAAEVVSTLEQARLHIDQVEIEQGRQLIAGLRPRLGCLESPADTGDLWTLYFLEAVAAWYDQDPDGALASLERALAVRPGQAYDPSYPPELRQMYQEAQQRVREPGWATLVAPTAADESVLVDGAAVPAGGLKLIGGVHLLQVRGVDGLLRGGRIEVQGGGAALVTTPDRLADAAGSIPPAQQAALATSLWTDLAGETGDRVWLVDDLGRVVALGEDGPRQTATVSGRARGGQPSVQLALGGGYQRLGRWDYLALDLDVTVRLVGPLRLGVFVLPAIGRTLTSPLDDTEQHTPVLPMFGVGAVVRIPGPVQPILGAFFQAGPDANQSGDDGARLLAGAGGMAGVQIPLGHAPLSVQPVVHGGFVGQYGVLRGLVTLVISL
jgi:hypothetical protein